MVKYAVCDAFLAIDVCINPGCWTEVWYLGFSLLQYTHTQTDIHRHILPPELLTSVTMVMKLQNDGPEDRYRASVKTAIIVLASKYSFRRLDAFLSVFLSFRKLEGGT